MSFYRGLECSSPLPPRARRALRLCRKRAKNFIRLRALNIYRDYNQKLNLSSKDGARARCVLAPHFLVSSLTVENCILGDFQLRR